MCWPVSVPRLLSACGEIKERVEAERSRNRTRGGPDGDFDGTGRTSNFSEYNQPKSSDRTKPEKMIRHSASTVVCVLLPPLFRMARN